MLLTAEVLGVHLQPVEMVIVLALVPAPLDRALDRAGGVLAVVLGVLLFGRGDALIGARGNGVERAGRAAVVYSRLAQVILVRVRNRLRADLLAVAFAGEGAWLPAQMVRCVAYVEAVVACVKPAGRQRFVRVGKVAVCMTFVIGGAVVLFLVALVLDASQFARYTCKSAQRPGEVEQQ